MSIREMKINPLPLKQNDPIGNTMRRWILLAILVTAPVLVEGQVDPYLAGRACMERGDYDSAVVQLRKALEMDPGKAEILYQLGISYFNLNQNPAALDAFYEADKRRKGMGSLYLAKTEVRLNHTEQAMKYLKEHLSSRYRIPEQELLQDPEILRLETKSGWRELWNEKEWYSQQDQTYQDALFMKKNDQELEAINLLTSLEKQGYKTSLVQAEKADIYMKLGNQKAARSAYRAAVRSDVRNTDALFRLAGYQMEDGDLEEALQDLDRVIRQDPSRFEAYLVRADARSMNHDLTGALEDVDLYLSYFPESHEAYYRRGSILRSHGKYLDAIQSFNRALQMNHGSAAYYFARGMTYAATGTIRYAEKDMSMALDLDPLNGEIWFEKGKVDEKLGYLEDACFCYRKAYQYGIFEAGEILEKRCR
jgi:tetratricopeptide (TPR) repeat protein